MLGESGVKLVEKGEWGSVVVNIGDLGVLWWWVGEFGSAVRCGRDDVQGKLFGARGGCGG
jgi:hypothetical protein